MYALWAAANVEGCIRGRASERGNRQAVSTLPAFVPPLPTSRRPRTALTVRRVTKILAKHKELLTKKEWVRRGARAAMCGILNPPPPLARQLDSGEASFDRLPVTETK